MANKFVFPIVLIGEQRQLTVEFTPDIEDMMDEIYVLSDELKMSGIEPKYIMMGKNQYKKAVAFVSYGHNKPVIPKDLNGIKIIVLDKDDYLDVLPDVEDMFTKMVKDDGEIV